jgi:hypothetical protein
MGPRSSLQEQPVRHLAQLFLEARVAFTYLEDSGHGSMPSQLALRIASARRLHAN